VAPPAGDRRTPAEPSDRGSLLGIDLGTSGLKAVLVGAGGAVLAEADADYEVTTPQEGAAETDPQEWVAACHRAVGRLLAGNGASATNPGTTAALLHVRDHGPAAIGIAGQMHGVVPVDASGVAVGPAVLWPDHRAGAVLAGWESLPEPERAALSNPLVAGMAGPILGRLNRTGPGGLRYRAPKDWLRARLTGDLVTERSDASATLLWDVVSDRWSPAAARLAGVSPETLPDVVGSSDVVGHAPWPLNAPEGGVRAPVVAGAADTAAVLTALSAVPGADGSRLVVNAGTGVQVLRTDAEPVPRLRPATHLYADCDGGWYEMLAVQNGGLALTWCCRVLGLDWDAFVASAASAPPGSGGAVFVPFLTGERGAVAAPDATAGWSGLTSGIGRGELARAAVEGYAFTIRRALDLMGDVAQTRILLTGGGLRTAWVRQLVVDVLDREARYVALRSATAVGAAVLAARGLGRTLSVAAEHVDVRPRAAGRYETAYRRWSRRVAAGS
jgi:xylulokinase